MFVHEVLSNAVRLYLCQMCVDHRVCSQVNWLSENSDPGSFTPWDVNDPELLRSISRSYLVIDASGM